MISHWRTIYRKNPSLKAQPPLEQKRCPGGWRDKTRGWGAEAGGSEGGLWAKPKSWGTGTKLRKMAEVSGRQINAALDLVETVFCIWWRIARRQGHPSCILENVRKTEIAWTENPEKRWLGNRVQRREFGKTSRNSEEQWGWDARTQKIFWKGQGYYWSEMICSWHIQMESSSPSSCLLLKHAVPSQTQGSYSSALLTPQHLLVP